MTANKKQIFLLEAPTIQIEKALEFVLKQIPTADVTLLLEAGRNLPESCKSRVKVIENHSRLDFKGILKLLRTIRNEKNNFDSAICIGSYKPYLWFTYLTGIKSKKSYADTGAAGSVDIKLIRLLTTEVFEYFITEAIKWLVWLISFPIVIFLRIAFGLESVVSLLVPKKTAEKTVPMENDNPPVSVVIPNYNGKELLAECLPSVVANMADAPPGSEVIVVDDASQDESLEFLSKNFPQVRVVPLPVNHGFGGACNKGISLARNRIVFLLNSDVIVKDGCIPRLVAHFKNPDVFTVQPKMLAWDGKQLNGGLNMHYEMFGYFCLQNERDLPRLQYVEEPGPTIYAIGGAMIFDKVKWDALGGFDPMFAPFCWEDIDVSYRALKRGWDVIYEPGSEVIHKDHGTLSKVFAPTFRTRIEQRNEMLFLWKNIHDSDMIKRHLRLFPAHIRDRIFSRDDRGFVSSLIKATAKIITVLKQRVQEKRYGVVSDREIVERVKRFHESICATERLELVKINNQSDYEAYIRTYWPERFAFEKRIAIENISNPGWEMHGHCEICSKTTVFLMDWSNSYNYPECKMPSFREGLLCPGCMLSNRLRFMAKYLTRQVQENGKDYTDVYLYEQVTNFYKYVKNNLNKADVIGSEYLGANRISGEIIDGIRHEDALSLSFLDDSIDIMVSNDVYEHVPDIGKALQEACRVLRSGGKLLFSIPFQSAEPNSRQRVTFIENELQYLLPEQYHGNPISEKGSLVFYDFGWDILETCKDAGFKDAYMLAYYSINLGYIGHGIQYIFVAEK